MIETVKTDMVTAYARTRVPWGGVTIRPTDTHMVLGTSEAYAVTMKTLGQSTIRIPVDASLSAFVRAYREATQTFNGQSDYIGIFHNANTQSIEFDPTNVYATKAEVDATGAHTHPDFDGAYEFHTGNGYYPESN